jgi:CubicO group peptidase (beta-lactamase class C family)
MSFGHTGYSGSSLWIDPEQDLFVILLTIRLDYQDVRQFNRLRSDISTLAVSIFSHPRMEDEISNTTQQP